MKFLVTQKQYALVQKMLPVMEQLYKNDIAPLFQLIAADYSLDPVAVEVAVKIVQDMGITAPNINKAMRLSSLSSSWKLEAQTIQDGPFAYAVKLEDDEEYLLEKTLDVFSRIVMGQLHILFETMDVPEEMAQNPHMMTMHGDVYWRGLHGGQEARDLLFPGIKEAGWNGGYGIASKDVAEDARLAYELSKALRKEYALHVTDEPVARLV